MLSYAIANAIPATVRFEALRKIVPTTRKVCTIVRGDNRFVRESIMAWCEANGVYYCFGLPVDDKGDRHDGGAKDGLD